METIKVLDPYWEQLKRLAIYMQSCVESGIHAPVCRDFWTWTIIASIGIATLIVALIAKRVIKEQLEFYRNKKRLEARAVIASDEVMRAATWRDDAPANDLEALPAAELAEKIRQALKKETKPAAPS